MNDYFFFLALLLAVLAAPAAAPAASPAADAVGDLLSGDRHAYEHARTDLIDLGPLAVPPLTDALDRELNTRARVRLEGALLGVLREQLTTLATEYERTLRRRRDAEEESAGEEAPKDGEPEEGGETDEGDGDNPAAEEDGIELMDLPGAGALAAAGPFGATILWRRATYAVGWQRELAGPLLARFRETFRTRAEAEPEATLARLAAADHLAAPFIVAAAKDETHPLHDGAAELLAAVLSRHVAELESDDSATRLHAVRALLDFRTEVLPVLEAARENASADLVERLDHVRLRVLWGIDDELFVRIGHAFESYAEQPWWRRRTMISETAALGQEAAIPCLRAVLARDPSLPVRVTAAQALALMGEPTGRLFLAGLGMASRHQDPRMNIPIFMSQGIKYLEVGRYKEAEAEFAKVLELDPDNDVAHYNMACTYSLWSKHEKSIEQLRLSIDQGFRDFEHIESDPDLDPIRHREDYKQLIREMKARYGSGGDDEDGGGDDDARDGDDEDAGQDHDAGDGAKDRELREGSRDRE